MSRLIIGIGLEDLNMDSYITHQEVVTVFHARWICTNLIHWSTQDQIFMYLMITAVLVFMRLKMINCDSTKEISFNEMAKT